MSLLELKTLTNNDLKKSLTQQINVEDWTFKYSKCGYPKLLHKNLHRNATCTEKQESLEVLNKNLEEYAKRIKLDLKALKED